MTLTLLLAFTAAQAQQATSPANDAAAKAALAGHLKTIVTLTGDSRQVGQPGNEAVDRYVKESFESLAKRANDPARAAAAKKAIEAADAANEQLGQVRMSLEVSAQTAARDASPLYRRLTIDNPVPLLSTLAILAASMLLAWHFQRQPKLLYAAVGSVIAAAVLVVASTLAGGKHSASPAPDGSAVVKRDNTDADVDIAARAAAVADLDAAKALTGLWQSGRITYPTAVFMPGRATLTTASGKTIALDQVAPNVVEPCNLPGLTATGPLVQVGDGSRAVMASRRLDGAIALMEFSSDRRWIEAVQLGAIAIIFVEPDGQDMTRTQAMQKFSDTMLSVPRFFASRKDVIAALGPDAMKAAQDTATVTIKQHEPGRWERKILATDWLFIPGTAEPKPPGTPPAEDAARQLVHIQAYKDSSSIVPARAPGGPGAINLAALLSLADGFAVDAPVRPVLLTAVNDHINALNGEQETAFATFANVRALTEEMDWVSSELIRQRFIDEFYRRPLDAQQIERVRSESDSVAGRVLKLRQPVIERLTFLRNVERQRIAKAAAEQSASAAPGATAKPLTPERSASLSADIAQARLESDLLLELMSLFNRFGSRTSLESLSATNRTRIEQLFKSIADQGAQEAQDLQQSREILLANLSLRRRLMFIQPAPSEETLASARAADLFAMRYRPLPATMMVSLDMTLGSEKLGLFFAGMLLDNPFTDADQRVSRLTQHTLRVAADIAQASGTDHPMVDTRNAGGVPWQGHLGGKFALAGQVGHQYAVPALALTSVDDQRLLNFTPGDTIDRVPAARAERLTGFVMSYLPALINSQDLGITTRTVGSPEPQSVEVTVRKLDEFSANNKGLPVPGALVLTYPTRQTLLPLGPSLGDVRPWMVKVSDRRGASMSRGSIYRAAGFLAFSYDESWSKLTSALDFNEGERQFLSTLALTKQTVFKSQSLMMFDATKVDLLGLGEPLTLAAVPQLDVLDALQDSMPRHFSTQGVLAAGVNKPQPMSRTGTACLMLEPTARFKLKIGQGVAINIDPSQPDNLKGLGFAATDPIQRDLALSSTRDMTGLTQSRLNKLSRSGVTNKTASDFTNSAVGRIKELANGGAAAAPGVEAARGMAYRGYTNALSTTNDLIKAVVIFLALVIPFCFFLMKLLSPYDDVNRQLAMFGIIFVLMAMALRLVHPAFSVAETPMVVLLAFVIFGLAAFVSVVMFGRFNSSMSQAVEESQMSESADAPQGRLAGAAFVVGVNNMKRRRIRTTLTCATIVLVTFTMLSVISVGQGLEPARVRVESQAPYNGLLYARPGMSAIPALQLERLRAHFDGAVTSARVWSQRVDEFGSYLPMRVRRSDGKGTALDVKVLLGLERAEETLTGTMPLLPGGQWFSSDSAQEIILSKDAAGLMGWSIAEAVGSTVTLEGRTLKVVGLVDDEPMRAMRDLAGAPLLPLLSEAKQESAAQSEAQAAAEAAGKASLDAGGSLTGAPGTSIAQARDVALVPLGIARSLCDGDYRTLSVKWPVPAGQDGAAQAKAAWDRANELIQYQHARVTVGLTHPVVPQVDAKALEPGQYALASNSSTEVGGILKVAVPIMLAATIILNTMLGSVMERKREVSIYNAIGLNPGHVMVFFLAESLVFGLVGSVAGYLIGQSLSLLFTRLNVPLNLNYSSLSVMVVIFLTIATVLLSTVYPAMMAARAAVPSGQRRWSLPQPKGDEIHVNFPFSYDATRVAGVCAYLQDYMQQNSEASTGTFLSRAVALGPVGGGVPGKPTYAMVFDVSPSPFDLGVNQRMEVYAYFDERVRAHMLSVHLTRLSGEKGNWVSVNQPFLESMRKRLLNWRSQKASTQAQYVERGQKLFEDAQPLRTSDVSAGSVAQEAGV